MIEITLAEVLILFLVFVRIVAIIALFPIFGHRSVPVVAKIGLALFLSILLFPSVKNTGITVPDSVFPLLMLITKEVLIGMVIGFTTILIFAGVQLGGSLIGMQMGFGIVRVMDPQTSQQSSIIGQVQQLLALLIFLAIDGHHFLIRSLFHSFTTIPLLGGNISGDVLMRILTMSAAMFEVAVKIGAPVIVSLLMTSVAMGIIARTVPQMNIFIVGFPLKIAVGMLVLTMSLPLFLHVFRKIFVQFQYDFMTLLEMIA